ncbi:MAG: efflux RND transporter periplasmic adaptor subunit [bacterium JZ-2024 1]
MRWLIGSVSLVLIGAIIWASFRIIPNNQASILLESLPTAKAEKGTFVLKLSVVGEIQTTRAQSITAPFNGKIVYLADEGFVKKGDLLVELDTEELRTQSREKQLQYDRASAEYRNTELEVEFQLLKLDNAVKEAEAKAELAQADLEQAQKNLERKRVLVEKGLEPKVNLEQAEIAFLKAQKGFESVMASLEEAKKNRETQQQTLKTRLESRKKELEKAKKDLEEIQERIRQAKIYAPTSGLVIHFTGWKRGSYGKIQKGDELWPGMTIMNFPDMSEIISVLKVDEVDIEKVQLGQRAEIRVDARPGHIYHGKVVRKGTVAVTELGGTRFGISISAGAPQTKGFQVDVLIEDADEYLRPGMTARTDIILGEIPDAVWIPLEALFDKEGNPVVYLKSGGKFRIVQVSTGERTSTEIQILSGLRGGETVFLTDPTKELKRYQPKERKALKEFLPRGKTSEQWGERRFVPPGGARREAGSPPPVRR